MFLVFDTETTGVPLWTKPSGHPDQAHLVDLACSLFDEAGAEVERYDTLVDPGVEIPRKATAVHGITTAMVREQGVPLAQAFSAFDALARKAALLVAHRAVFDLRIMRIASVRATGVKWTAPCADYDTMWHMRSRCGKLPTLAEATWNAFRERLPQAHRARPDCDATARLFFYLRKGR